ncbi:MAG: AAA family ATPase [Alphaproteobacteria bacterium]|nr:AAA family ATPase [Alphaproteobacteria bacterium]OJV13697.1 MAG: hypothetical protein BGO27_00810 [Alphaproteobacteria bacterium 33-17]
MNTVDLMNALSPDQHQAINAVREGRNVFITGKAGTGKSFLITLLKALYHDRGIEITATTGIAAVNIGGATIHSFSGIGAGDMPVEFIVKRLKSAKSRQMRKKIKECRLLVIDEISMLASDTIDKIDMVFRNIREVNVPFGGIQVVLIGDFAQLPPVTRDNQYSYAFNSQVWREANLKVFVLKSIFRQKDPEFIELLNNIRLNQLSDKDVRLLKSRENLKPDFKNLTIIATHNDQVDRINTHFLKELNTTSQSFKMEEYGDDKDKLDYLKKYCLAPSSLELKIGAQVMMLKNTHYKEGIINGSTGKVLDFIIFKGRKLPVVRFNNGVEKVIEYESWALEDICLETGRLSEIASIAQLPLSLAWAITVHKSQGMSIDRIYCDLSKAFAPGQVYVALSRARSLEGLYIQNFNPRKIIVNQQVKDFEHSLA